VIASLSGLSTVFVATKVNYGAVLPMLVIFGAAMIGVLVEAFAPRAARYTAQVTVALVGLVVALLAVGFAVGQQGSTLAGAVVIDGPALFLQGTILALSVLSVLAMAERFEGTGADAFTAQGASAPGSAQESAAVRAGASTTEVFPLTMFCIGGMLLFPAAGDLLTMFIALEVLSLPLYILSGLASRRRLLSQEASLKYFLLGAFSSAFFLFGSALLFGYAGSMDLSVISKAIGTQSGMDGLLIPGIALVLVGLLFKIGAVPFHSWTPDVYQGAPTPVTGFMAACTKVAAFGAILRFIYVGVAGSRWDWSPALWGVAILTMVVGAVLSVTQTDIKRLLAYSSIAHAGFVMTGLLAFDKVGVSAVMFYVVAYGFATIAAFAIVSLVREGGSEATHLSQWAGLGKNHPVVAGAFAFLLLAFAGIPLTSGFTAKFAVFSAAIDHGATPLAVVGVLSSAIAAFVYVRVVVLMYFSTSAGDTVRVVSPSILTAVAVSLGVVVTLVLGIVPGPLLDLASRSSLFLR
jgi:NADH-quinone oxidoreductase subunit N